MIQRWQILAFLLSALAATPAHASGARLWELAGPNELSSGTFEGTAASSRGEIIPGCTSEPVGLDPVGAVWSAIRDAQGRTYLGTGYEGNIYRLEGTRAVLVAKTGGLLVTSMAFDNAGNLYAATLPAADIWKVEAPERVADGQPQEAQRWTTLPLPAEHIFSLAWDGAKKRLYAGTGPTGHIYAVGADAKPALYLDTGEQHVLSLAVSPSGALLAGTGPGALLLEVTAPGQYRVVADFSQSEVRAIAPVPSGGWAVAVNHFKVPAAAAPRAVTAAQTAAPANTAAPQATPAAPQAKPATQGEGRVFRCFEDGRIEAVYEDTTTLVQALAVAADDTIYAGLGANGTVVAIAPDLTQTLYLDLPEREILALMADDTLVLAATGDAGAAYRIRKSAPQKPTWISPVLDAGTHAQWGALAWYGQGRFTVTTRSGNSAVPNKAWSPWERVAAPHQRPASPAARYFQLRVQFPNDPQARLTSVQLPFLPRNQRPIITEFNADTRFDNRNITLARARTKPQEAALSRRTTPLWNDKRNTRDLPLSWKVQNPDGDALRYELHYRPEGETLWRPILKPDQVLTALKYTWSTEGIPEGRYQIRLTVDDSLSRAPEDVLTDARISAPVLIDNQPPHIRDLQHRNGRIQGQAVDTFSRSARLEYSLDGAPWVPAACADGICDSPSERFDFPLPTGLSPGPHAIAVRAFDEAGNLGAAEIHIDVSGGR